MINKSLVTDVPPVRRRRVRVRREVVERLVDDLRERRVNVDPVRDVVDGRSRNSSVSTSSSVSTPAFSSASVSVFGCRPTATRTSPASTGTSSSGRSSKTDPRTRLESGDFGAARFDGGSPTRIRLSSRSIPARACQARTTISSGRPTAPMRIDLMIGVAALWLAAVQLVDTLLVNSFSPAFEGFPPSFDLVLSLLLIALLAAIGASYVRNGREIPDDTGQRLVPPRVTWSLVAAAFVAAALIRTVQLVAPLL
jgi:hypothetical protein